MEGLIEGRIVHAVIEGVHHPAIIVKVHDQETGLCDIQVFNDREDPAIVFLSDYEYDATGNYRWGWHWIEKT